MTLAPGGAGDFVAPAYGARSLGDVVPAVARALGHGHALADDGPSDLVLPDAPAYVVFLIDGLGARLLERHAEAAPFLAGLAAGSAHGTAGVPSTTAPTASSGSPAASPAPTGSCRPCSGTSGSTRWSGSPTRRCSSASRRAGCT